MYGGAYQGGETDQQGAGGAYYPGQSGSYYPGAATGQSGVSVQYGGYPGQSYNFYGASAGALPMGQDTDETPGGPDASGTAAIIAPEAPEEGLVEEPASFHSSEAFDDLSSLADEEEFEDN